jgi:hypothetical protein
MARLSQERSFGRQNQIESLSGFGIEQATGFGKIVEAILET